MTQTPITKGQRIERLIRIPPGLYEKLSRKARAENRSINGQMLVAIEEHLKRRNGA